MQHGVGIQLTGHVPQGLEVDFQLKVYNASDCFDFQQGYTLCSQVYEICVSATQRFPLNHVRLTLTLVRRLGILERCYIMEALRIPTKWESNFTPKYTFRDTEREFNLCHPTVEFSLRSSSCYLAIAGTKL